MTGWFGLVVTAVTLALLAGRQLAAATGADRRWLRLVDVALVPLLIAFAAVMVIRFDQMSY